MGPSINHESFPNNYKEVFEYLGKALHALLGLPVLVQQTPDSVTFACFVSASPVLRRFLETPEMTGVASAGCCILERDAGQIEFACQSDSREEGRLEGAAWVS